VPSVGRDIIVAHGAAARIAATATRAAAPAQVAAILGIPSGRRALRRTESRSADGQPAAITTAWSPRHRRRRAPPGRVPAGSSQTRGSPTVTLEADGGRVTAKTGSIRWLCLPCDNRPPGFH
jgi:hypothetical protein